MTWTKRVRTMQRINNPLTLVLLIALVIGLGVAVWAW